MFSSRSTAKTTQQFIYVTEIRPVDVVNALSTVDSELLIGRRHHVCGLEVVDSL